MERFPALSLLVKFGHAGAILAALAVLILVLTVGWPALGWVAVIVALLAGALVYIMAKSFVELVTIVTEMLVPR